MPCSGAVTAWAILRMCTPPLHADSAIHTHADPVFTRFKVSNYRDLANFHLQIFSPKRYKAALYIYIYCCHANGDINAAPKFRTTQPVLCVGGKIPLKGHLNSIDALVGTSWCVCLNSIDAFAGNMRVCIFFFEQFHGVMYGIY